MAASRQSTFRIATAALGIAIAAPCRSPFESTSMSHTPRDHLMQWLRDAHAMEEHAADMLHKSALRVRDGYPELSARLQEQADISLIQAQRVEECILRRNGDTSPLKDLAARASGAMQALSGVLACDEVVRVLLAAYAFEHMEIASYRAVSVAARVCGDIDTQRVCGLHIAQEKDMATWLEGHLPELTQRFIRDSLDAAAQGQS